MSTRQRNISLEYVTSEMVKTPSPEPPFPDPPDIEPDIYFSMPSEERLMMDKGEVRASTGEVTFQNGCHHIENLFYHQSVLLFRYVK